MFDVTMTDSLQYKSRFRWFWQYHSVRSKTTNVKIKDKNILFLIYTMTLYWRHWHLWYVMLEMDFSLNLTSQAWPSLNIVMWNVFSQNQLTIVYSRTCLMCPSKVTVKYGHIKQIVAQYRFNWYEMHCEGK